MGIRALRWKDYGTLEELDENWSGWSLEVRGREEGLDHGGLYRPGIWVLF